MFDKEKILSSVKNQQCYSCDNYIKCIDTNNDYDLHNNKRKYKRNK